MATQLNNVTRRGFLSGTAGAIATSGAALLPQGKMPKIEQMAQALHNAVGRYSNEGGPSHVEVCSPVEDHSITFEMEILRPCSVDEIQQLLMPLYLGGAS